jgi:hypothetical protein
MLSDATGFRRCRTFAGPTVCGSAWRRACHEGEALRHVLTRPSTIAVVRSSALPGRVAPTKAGLTAEVAGSVAIPARASGLPLEHSPVQFLSGEPAVYRIC